MRFRNVQILRQCAVLKKRMQWREMWAFMNRRPHQPLYKNQKNQSSSERRSLHAHTYIAYSLRKGTKIAIVVVFAAARLYVGTAKRRKQSACPLYMRLCVKYSPQLLQSLAPLYYLRGKYGDFCAPCAIGG